MVKVIVDTSIWIDYLKCGKYKPEMELLLRKQKAITTEAILLELIPVLIHHKQDEIVDLLRSLERVPVFVNWTALVDAQVKCLKNGMNKIGPIDLIIMQSAIEYSVMIFSADKHFKVLNKHFDFKLYEPESAEQ